MRTLAAMPERPTKSLSSGRDGLLQRKSDRTSNHSPTSVEAPPIVHEVLRSPGRPLDAESRAFMEPRFGYDFSRVRVHADSQAAKSAEAVNAQAYTVGSNIIFGANQGGAGNLSHPRLLAHELAHVVQQGGRQPGGSLQVAPANDSAEGAADRAADQVLSGGQASNSTKADGRLQRYGFNPECTATQTNQIHQAIDTANRWVGGALRALAANPLSSDTLSALQHNFGAAGTAANVGTIIARLNAGRADMLNNPYACRNAANDPHCQSAGAYTVGPGSHASTICTNRFTRPDAIGRAATVLHEAMHASDAAMTVDSYSDYFGHRRRRFASRDYPGTDPLINADSYATLALELGKDANSNAGNTPIVNTPQSSPRTSPGPPTASPAGGSNSLLQRKNNPALPHGPSSAEMSSDRGQEGAVTPREPRFGYSRADAQVHPQSVSGQILQRQPAPPETKKEDAPEPAKSGETPAAPAATPTAASNKCPPLPAPGFEAILSPRDKLDTRKPNGQADFHAGV
ncbi:MAG TPA: DUF4157 domain-containing protein, partial [Opitutaceae bacterium]|nr:DUF4157 domain-containing protein [Opitutaceae bacterium]